MKVGKFLAAVIFAVFFLAENCFAMKFSQPVKTGSIFSTPADGVVVENATYDSGKILRNFNGKKTYSNFIARWGDEENGIYCYWDKYPPQFGNKDGFFPVKVMVDTSIEMIKTNESAIFYMLINSGSDIFAINFVLIGRQKDGKWVKLFDTDAVQKSYPIPKMAYFERNYFVRGDTLIIEYKSLSGDKKIGEFRFKWDEAAQWFSVEQIKY